MGDFDFVRPTQKALRHLVDNTPLTEKLLSRPPFQYIRTIVASVIRTTGYMANLFSNADLYSKELVNKEFKLLFLRNVIAAVEQTLNRTVEAKPGKIIAGLEPEVTNKFLQDLAEAAVKHRSRRKSQERALTEEHAENGSRKQPKGLMAKPQINGKPAAPKGHEKDKGKASREKPVLSAKGRKETLPKKGKEVLESSKKPERPKVTPSHATEKEKHRSERRRSSNEKRKEERTKQPEAIVEQPAVPVSKMEDIGPIQAQEPVDVKQEELENGEAPAMAPVQQATRPAPKLPAPDETKPPELEVGTTDFSASKPKVTAVPREEEPPRRPPSRPSTARTAPPRVISAVVEEPPAAASKAAEQKQFLSSEGTLGENDEGPDLWGTAAPVERIAPNESTPESGGRLVHKILETKRQLEEQALLANQSPGYLMVTDDEELAQVKQLTTKLAKMVQQFARNVQTTSSNFGLLVESAQNLGKEWQSYRRETERFVKRLEELKREDDPVEASLNEQLSQLDQDIEKRLHISYALRKRLFENEAKLHILLEQ